MFSLDQWLATPPLSALFSILIIAGLDLFGVWILRAFNFEVNSYKDWVRWQAPIVGAMLLAIILYPLALAGLTPLKLMQSVAIFIMGGGILHLISEARLVHGRAEKLSDYLLLLRAQSYSRKLLLLLLLGMGMLALGPVTNADALDYHMGVAIAVLNHGGMPVVPEWFIGRLAGNGEVLNAMALSLGAEQFGALLQFVSLIGIVGIILYVNQDGRDYSNKFERATLDLIALAAFSAPVLLFLVTSPKPQMWPIAMTTFAFTLVVHRPSQNISTYNAVLRFALICALVMTASQAKFNFLLGGAIVGLLSTQLIFKEKIIWKSIAIGIFISILIILPPVLWKALAFDAGYMETLINPLPGHLPGTDAFLNLAKGAFDFTTPLPFPISMFIPASLGAFTTLLGIGPLVFIGMRLDRNLILWSGAISAIVVVLVNALYAPPSSRMYLEPYFWLMAILSFQKNKNLHIKNNLISKIVFTQAVAVTVVVWIGAITVFPGALTDKWRTDVMMRMANGYEVMQWADTVLPKDSVVLNGHRSMALIPRDAVAFEWSNFVDLQKYESTIYLNRIKEKNVSHMLVIGGINEKTLLYGCFTKKIDGPGSGHTATRNPFNQAGKYEAWIVGFESKKLPECARERSLN